MSAQQLTVAVPSMIEVADIITIAGKLRPESLIVRIWRIVRFRPRPLQRFMATSVDFTIIHIVALRS